jgi:NADP-dependent 3-hydroxy acid dehydrogenase YdfG
MNDSTDQVVLVTGAAGGIGSAVVRRFSQGGWRVVAADLSAPVSDEAEHAFAADLTHAEECRSLVGQAVAVTGRLDCIGNTAGVWTEGPVELTEESAFDRCLDVNLKGLFFTIAAAVPHLVATAGSVVNLSSDAGLLGNTGAAMYCASRARSRTSPGRSLSNSPRKGSVSTRFALAMSKHPCSPDRRATSAVAIRKGTWGACSSSILRRTQRDSSKPARWLS